MYDLLNILNQPRDEAIRPPIVYVDAKPVWAYKQMVRNLTKETWAASNMLKSLG